MINMYVLVDLESGIMVHRQNSWSNMSIIDYQAVPSG